MKTKIIAIALSALAIATPAMAQDADKTGAYGALHAGVNMPSEQRFTFQDIEVDLGEGDFASFDSFAIDIDAKNAVEFGATLGYDFGMIRADVDVSYSRAKIKRVRFASASIEGETVTAEDFEDAGIDVDELAGDNDIDGKVRRLSGMANVWVDIPVGQGIAPYVGGGLGVQGLEFGGEGKASFAWQLGAGVLVPLSESVAVSADYRYRQQKKFTLRDTDFGDVEFGKAKSSSIFVSLRANF